ncbi:CinA family nicotinamide mononucleotide deamidase-related protein [Microbacter margulisiae]|uniref:CinA-like protein n=1 Tax=Microbacter margulisiae TaxID=1350067 RepID=A0A7W5H194_9PORP|nr:CinA family nicotinamide mononucleotide deamidase-related protein [Microbacter margulisiae]MBB3186126.1 nicotinamide-nucleotide amidase [Microbacter margulisiae]
MNVEIMTIGDELLIGQVVDTNSAWMGAMLTKEGFHIQGITSIGDEAIVIKETLARLMAKSNIVLITGGLGPTNDDITLKTLAEFFNTSLVFDASVYADIERFFEGRKDMMNTLNRDQALVPADATVIHNKVGTAPITWFEKEGKVVVSMPGVPVEMKQVMSDEILPRLKQRFNVPSIQHRHILVHGIGESSLAIQLEEWESALPSFVKLAYLPQVGLVRLRLTASLPDEALLTRTLDEAVEKVVPLLGNTLLALEDTTPAEVIDRLLKQKKISLSVAESCTGGNIAHLITSQPGCSEYFKGGVVAYDNDVKCKVLNVSSKDINEYGAVSRQVVERMASGVRQLLQTDVAVATSGIAGPTGGTPEKLVGTVWIAVATANQVMSRVFQFGNIRDRNITRASIEALAMVKEMVEQ